MTGEWTKEKTLELIAKYKARRGLWDTSDNSYYKRNKSVLWEELANEMGATLDETKRRMQSLLASMRRERARVRKSLAQNGEMYKSTWFAFDSLSFLLDRPIPPMIKNSVDNSCDDYNGRKYSKGGCTLADLISRQIDLSDLNNGIKQEEDSTDGIEHINDVTKVELSETDAEERLEFDADEGPSGRKKMKIENVKPYHNWNAGRFKVSPSKLDPEDEANDSDKRSLSNRSRDSNPRRNQQSDDCYSFGRYVADKLKTYSWTTKCAVQHAISEILFSAELGRFENYCDGYNSIGNMGVVMTNRNGVQDEDVDETRQSIAGSSRGVEDTFECNED